MSLPSRVGRYEILGPLASGGMAEILLARATGPSGFERLVVIKRILPHLARQDSFVSMFLDEARIISGIRHPNVVNVQELGHEGDELFLAMEYLEGESASALLRRSVARSEPLDPALGAYVVARACEGLHAAHELTDLEGKPQNIVHRDVSPQNVFVTYPGEVKILDFGIAKAADRITRTEAGQLKGKFEYMSPEQCKAKPIDRRSDVFSLGIVLYELTSGRRLFKRATQFETLNAIAREPVVPPSRLRDDYPKDLEAIVLRSLARDPGERYPTADAMRRDLVAFGARLRADTEPRDHLAQTMQRLFDDRIVEKRELLRQVQRGSTVGHVPAGEVTETIEVPTVEGASIATEATAPDGPSQARRGALGGKTLLGAMGALVAVAVLGTVAFRTRGDGSAAPSSGTRAAGDPAGPVGAVSAQAQTAAPAASVVIHIETRPSVARVLLDGTDRGATPLDLSLARSSTPIGLSLEKPGFAPLGQTVVPDVEQRIVVALDPQAPAPLVPRRGRAGASRSSPPLSSPAQGASPTAPASSAGASSPFHRFD